MGRSDTGMTTGWREGKPWEIALGELRGEGAIRKRQEGGRGGTVGNIAWGELRWEGASGSDVQGGKERYTEADDRVDGAGNRGK